MPIPWFSHPSDCSVTMSLVCISAIAATVFRDLYSLHLHLVSCGLCSWVYLLIFPYYSQVWVDTNVELVILCVTLVFVAWNRVGHRLYPCKILPLSRCSIFPCFFLHLWLRLHLPLLSSSPLCYASHCAFLEGIANTIFSIFSILPLYTLYNVGAFLFLEYLNLTALLESL